MKYNTTRPSVALCCVCKRGKLYKYVKVHQYLGIYYEAYIENQYINLFEIFSILYYIIEDLENIFFATDVAFCSCSDDKTC